jgi:hypothetical protein
MYGKNILNLSRSFNEWPNSAAGGLTWGETVQVTVANKELRVEYRYVKCFFLVLTAGLWIRKDFFRIRILAFFSNADLDTDPKTNILTGDSLF